MRLHRVLGQAFTRTERSPILQSRVDVLSSFTSAALLLIVMSGDGREANYNEPSAMKEYAVSCGVSADDVFCDPGGYNTYDTMWRVSRVFGAESCLVVTQEYHLYRAVFDAQGVGMDARGIVSDEGTYNDQLWYDIREIAGRTHDFWNIAIGAVPDKPGAAISL
ncbi:MAG: vancomycin high temperature exclusion protein [Eggerthellaceae bacterium]